MLILTLRFVKLQEAGILLAIRKQNSRLWANSIGSNDFTVAWILLLSTIISPLADNLIHSYLIR